MGKLDQNAGIFQIIHLATLRIELLSVSAQSVKFNSQPLSHIQARRQSSFGGRTSSATVLLIEIRP